MSDPPGITGAVARTLQALRTERGWSLDQLVVRSGVSKGVLVALEQGRSNPSLGTLAGASAEPAVRVSAAPAARILWRGPAGGTGTILAATDPPWAAELWHWL